MDIFDSLQRVNEQNEVFWNDVELSLHFKSPAPGTSGLDDDYYVDGPKNISLPFHIEVEYRSWGIKDINVSFSGTVEFEATIRSDLPEEEGKEEVVPVKIDFSEVTPRINWVEGSGVAPAELHVTLGEGNKVVEVEVDFYYWAPNA